MVDAAGGTPRALTTGTYEEHSIDWSPDGREILLVSNREPEPDRFYNPDLFALSRRRRKGPATDGYGER